MSKGSKGLIYFAVFLNTVILYFLAFWLMSLPWLAGDEKFLIWSTSAVRLQSQQSVSPDEIALINVSYDLALIDKFDSFGFPVGNQAITDRDKLTELFKILNEYQCEPKYIFCDVFYKDPTDADERLLEQLEKRNDIILSYHLDADGYPDYPLFESVNKGLSDYVTGSIFEGVYKYQLFYSDSLKLTPLKAFESISGLEAKKTGPFVKLGQNLLPNNFILNYRLLQKDLEAMDSDFAPINLGELLLLPPEDIVQFLNGRIVVIGDFLENDFHETIFEITAGPLILLNALLSLQMEDTKLDFVFFLITFCFFSFLSYLVFFPGDMIEEYLKSHFGDRRFLQYVLGFMSYFLILVACSLITYGLFNIHLNVFYIAIYLYVVDRVMHLFQRRTSR